MAVTPPPRKPAVSPPAEVPARGKLAEKQLNAIINRGSSTVAAASEATTLKNFNIRLPAAVLTRIDEVRALRPRKPTSPKLGVSTQDWLLEAITEKLEREEKKYRTGEK